MIPMGSARRGEPVQSITQVGARRTGDLPGRQARYLVSMGIRTACFLGAVAATGWLRWVLVAAAFLLPYFAVVLANAGRERATVLPVAVFNAPGGGLAGAEYGRLAEDRRDTPTRPGRSDFPSSGS